MDGMEFHGTHRRLDAPYLQNRDLIVQFRGQSTERVAPVGLDGAIVGIPRHRLQEGWDPVVDQESIVLVQANVTHAGHGGFLQGMVLGVASRFFQDDVDAALGGNGSLEIQRPAGKVLENKHTVESQLALIRVILQGRQNDVDSALGKEQFVPIRGRSIDARVEALVVVAREDTPQELQAFGLNRRVEGVESHGMQNDGQERLFVFWQDSLVGVGVPRHNVCQDQTPVELDLGLLLELLHSLHNQGHRRHHLRHHYLAALFGYVGQYPKGVGLDVRVVGEASDGLLDAGKGSRGDQGGLGGTVGGNVCQDARGAGHHEGVLLVQGRDENRDGRGDPRRRFGIGRDDVVEGS